MAAGAVFPRMRSWLFAPGDSERKMAKACASEADIVLLDLEDSVLPENKPAARELVRQFLRGRPDKQRIWVGFNPVSGPEAEAERDAIRAGGPGTGKESGREKRE